jgi:PEP-CTERM motif
MSRSRVSAALLVLCLTAATPAFGASVGFGCITNSSAGDCSIGETQLQLDITDEGPGQVRFTFSNSGPQQSVISEVYFDDGVLLGIASIVNGAGVVFQQDANPPNLPGGNNVSPPFEVTAGFLAESVPSPSMNGVGPGEYVAIIFNLQGAATFNDVLTQLSDGTVRAGIHVISFASGGSESFVNNPVPEPSASLLLLAGLGGVALRRSHRAR